MRTLSNLFIIAVLLFTSAVNTNAQTRKEVQFSLDTLIKANNDLKEDFKSVKADWKEQNNFFEHVKSTFFDPADINASIEEGIAKFDEINEASVKKMEELALTNKSLTDSLAFYKNKANELETSYKGFERLLMASLNAASFPQSASELTGNWNLFLNPVQISGEPFKSGLVGFNPFVPKKELVPHNIYRIEFAQDEIATLYFSNGKVQKSFFTINGFSSNSPYSVTFTKGDEFKLTLLISPLPNGLMVSYEAPIKADKLFYFYGLMKK